jgi:hypothetical protein
MAARKDRAFLRRSFVLSLILGALAFIPSAPLSTPVLEAQGRSDLEAQHRRLLPLFELAGVVFTDADETSGRLVVGVLDRDVEGLVRGRLRALGVANQSVDVVETDAIFALASLRDTSPTIQGGVQINFSQYLCSLGFIALRNGEEGFVTASHCSDRQGAVDGTAYYQPSSQVSNSFIGNEIADPPYVRNSSGCPKGRKCRESDANFSRSEGTRGFSLGRIARTNGLGSLEVAGTFAILNDGVAAQGQLVDKVGRTTGWTRGRVSNTCVNTGVSGTSIVLLCQTFVESTDGGAIVAGGDSGSPTFISSGTNATLVGGLWGGSQDGKLFVYSPIDNIKDELGNTLTTH